MIWECIDKLNNLDEINEITLHWVPGHAGVDGNEEANKLVKEEQEEKSSEKEVHGKELERAKLFKELPKLRQAKLLLENFNWRRSTICINLDRNKLRILLVTGFQTAHYKL